MSLQRHFATLAILLSIVAANEAPDLKRSTLLESGQECQTAGWIPACPGFFACVPPGAVCCSDGINYVMPPDTCPNGSQPVTTAGLSSPSTSVPSSQSTITTPPIVTQTLLPYAYYTFTITWYYWYYYFTYVQIDAATVTTSYQVTTITTVSVQATDEEQATSNFRTLSATLVFPTPTQAVTALSGVPGPLSTSMSQSSLTTEMGASTVASTAVGTISAGPANTTAVQFTGAAVSLRAGSFTKLLGMEWVIGALIIVPALSMIWL